MPGGNRRFALDTYQRFLHTFGETVLSIDSKIYENIIHVATRGEGVDRVADLSEQGLEYLVDVFKKLGPIPENPMRQFWMVLKKMLDSSHEIRFVCCCHRVSYCFCSDSKIGELRVPTAIIVQVSTSSSQSIFILTHDREWCLEISMLALVRVFVSAAL